jgi:hypothetical protein
MKVNNINGTSGKICSCGSWLNHWKNVSGISLPGSCREIKCLNLPEVGAHVQKDDSADKNWYIVLLCDQHNRQTGKSIEIMDFTVLVSANVSLGCGKKFRMS